MGDKKVNSKKEFMDGLEGVGRTMRVATKSAQDDLGEIIKASELIHVTPAGNKQLSIGARKILNFLLETAAGHAWEDRVHVVPKADLRRRHKANDRVDEYVDELHRTTLVFDVLSPRGKEARLKVPLLRATVEENEGDGLCYFQFTDEVREMLRQSSTYAVLNSHAVYAFESGYSIVMYEIGCQRVGLRNPTVELTVQQVRQLFNVPVGAYKDFGQLNASVLKKAKKEVDALSHFTVHIETKKSGRTVTKVILKFWKKSTMGEMQAAELLRLTRDERRAMVNREVKGKKSQVQLQMEELLNEEAQRLGLEEDQKEISLDDEIIY